MILYILRDSAVTSDWQLLFVFKVTRGVLQAYFSPDAILLHLRTNQYLTKPMRSVFERSIPSWSDLSDVDVDVDGINRFKGWIVSHVDSGMASNDEITEGLDLVERRMHSVRSMIFNWEVIYFYWLTVGNRISGCRFTLCINQIYVLRDSSKSEKFQIHVVVVVVVESHHYAYRCLILN